MTNSKWFGNSDADPIGDLMRRIAAVESYANDIERRLANYDSPQPVARVDPLTYLNPYEGQRAIDPADEQHMWYSNGEWRKAAAGGGAIYEIKVFEDDEVNIVKNRAFVWEIPEDLDGGIIMKAGAFVTTPSGDQVIDISFDGGATILEDNIEIPAGDKSSKTGVTPQAVGGGVEVAWGDQLSINTLSASGMGLGTWVLVFNAGVGGVTIVGEKGDPGGITNWSGTWTGNAPASAGAWTTATGYTVGQVVQSGGTFYVATSGHTSGSGTQPGVGGSWATVWQVVNYTTGDAVSNNGSSYVAIVDHPATTDSEPGVGADWEDFWMLLSENTHTATAVYYG